MSETSELLSSSVDVQASRPRTEVSLREPFGDDRWRTMSATEDRFKPHPTPSNRAGVVQGARHHTLLLAPPQGSIARR
jgi:hypothetical protein